MLLSTPRAEFAARYFVESSIPSEKAAEVIAGEQSSGAFMALPGETDELKERSRARVVRINPLPAVMEPTLASALVERRPQGGRLLGQRMGQIVEQVLRTVPLRRLILSGGDRSSQITQQLAPGALLIAARLAPGAPLSEVRRRSLGTAGKAHRQTGLKSDEARVRQ